MQYEWYKEGCALLNEIYNTTLPEDMVGIWWLGQVSLAVKYKDKLLWLDPFFTEVYDENGEPIRQWAPPFAPKKIIKADYITGSHDHLDHIDVDTLVPIAENVPEVKIIVPAPHTMKLRSAGIRAEQVVGGRAFDKIQLADDISITPIPAAHEDYKQDDHGDHENLSYLIQLGDICIFHGGDMVWKDDTLANIEKLGAKIDIACLPINGADYPRTSTGTIGNLNAREAADLAQMMGAEVVLPLHYDMFLGNDENPAVFADYMYRYHKTLRYHVFAHGECYIYRKA